MKASKLSLAILGSTLLISSIGYAQEKGKLVLHEAVSVGGAVLSPGTYTVEWSVKDSSAEVRFAQGKKAVAVVQGTVVSCPTANSANSYETEAEGGGYSMTAYSPERMKYRISLNHEVAAK